MGHWGTPMDLGYVAMAVSLLVLGSIFFILWMSVGLSGSSSARRPISVEELLADRYARGEIDEAEYRRRLAVLDRARER